jgi:hypothetical protein
MKAHGKIPTWRWILFGAFFILFPIVFRPWWLAIAAFAAAAAQTSLIDAVGPCVKS